MKLIMENFKRFLRESINKVKFSGILKIMPSPDIIAQAQPLIASLPEEAVPLGDDRLHVTLVHQSILKPYRKMLKKMSKAGELPPAPAVVLDPQVEERVDEELGRKSWVAWVKNQNDMKNYVNEIMEIVGGQPNPEPNRVFHISLANLTGNPGDSVK
tara:strand:+ start:2638 stop:3108 length:471 start_codon:yes stop_codon:yes gene_type:complete